MARKKVDNIIDEIEEFEKTKIIKDKVFLFTGLFLIFLSVFLVSSLFGLGGGFGDDLFKFLTTAFGVFAYIFPIGTISTSLILLLKRSRLFITLEFILLVVIFASLFILLGFFDLTGKFGKIIADIFRSSIGMIPTFFLFLSTLIISLIKLFDADLSFILNIFSQNKIQNREPEYLEDMPTGAKYTQSEMLPENMEVKNTQSFFSRFFGSKTTAKPEEEYFDPTNEQVDDEDEYEYEDAPKKEDDVRESMFKDLKIDLNKEEKEKIRVRKAPSADSINSKENSRANVALLQQLKDPYRRPPLSLYTEDSGKSSAGDNKENARIIKRTLADFGISVEMDEVTVGPTVTRYALKPAQGVKIEKIMSLANNIALELGVQNVSIIRVHERSLIGIEVPNKSKSKLGLSNLFANSQFLDRKEKLTLTLGKDIYGEPVYTDMARMPHLLVAGTTGAGKSVLVHAIINSLIYKNSPYDLKFILIDPKKVELALYSKLPHLYTPVIKDPKKAVQTLNWLVQEMDRRYEVLESAGKQNIGAYHSFVLEKYKRAESSGKNDTSAKLPEKMPFIVLVIDELNDFMMKYPKEIEGGITKLAAMSRAVGIHLILCTQRPSTNVITGVIKANIPSRIALRVASQVDSRVIIDAGGAEKLLGYGDLLFINSDNSDAKRIQSPFVSEDEIKDVVNFLRAEYDDVLTEELKAKDGSIVGATSVSPYTNAEYTGEEDDRYEEARQIVIDSKQASTSFLQRRMGLGYSRAAKMMDILQAKGVISAPGTGNKQRKVLIGDEEGSPAFKNEQLEKEADSMLAENGAKEMTNDSFEEDDERSSAKQKASSGFFRF